MKPFTVLPIVLTAAIASSCQPSATQSLAGQSYQETDADSQFYNRIGVEFIDDSEFVLKLFDQELIELPGQYTVESGSITARLDNPEFATADVQMQRQGNALDVSIDDLEVSLESVDELALTDQPFEGSSPEGQADARTYISSINRGQQIFFLENDRFATAIVDLGLDVPTETEQYDIDIQSGDGLSVSLATPKAGELNSYLGVVITNESTTQSVLCELTSEEAPVPELSSIVDQVDPRSLTCPLGNEI